MKEEECINDIYTQKWNQWGFLQLTIISVFYVPRDYRRQIEWRGESSKLVEKNQGKSSQVRFPTYEVNKGVVGGNGCATQCIIMTSLLETAASLPRWWCLCKSWYLRVGCYRFVRPLGSRKIVRLDEPPSSLSSGSYKSRMGTQLVEILHKTPRYVVFHILYLCHYYCLMSYFR